MGRIDESYFEINDGNKNKKIVDVKQVLSEDETILLTLKPNKKAYILENSVKMLPFVIIWLAFDTFFILTMAFTGAFEDVPELLYFIIPFFILHLMPVWIYIANLFRATKGFKNISYYFTDQRIIVKSGLVGIDFKSIYYEQIVGVNLKVGPIERMFKVGDIYIRATSQSCLLDDIDNPYQYLSKIQGIVNEVKKDVYFPNDLR